MKRSCAVPLCSGAAVPGSGYCEKHRRPRTSGPSGYQAPKGWKAFAAKFRADHPFCADCGSPTEICGHRVRHEDLVGTLGPDYLTRILEDGEPLTWFVPLCSGCNQRQRWAETGARK